MTHDLVIPPTTPADNGWEQYSEPIAVSSTLRPGSGSPEAAVAQFYAALMGGDLAAQAAVLPPEDEMLAPRLAKLRAWTFLEVQLRGRRLRGTARATIKIWVSVRHERGVSEDEDDVEVRRDDDGSWRVTRPPT